MATAQKGMVGLFKRAWHEIPEVVGSSFMALIGVGIGVAAVANYYTKDGDNRRYREQYTVIRHDDPRVKFVRTD